MKTTALAIVLLSLAAACAPQAASTPALPSVTLARSETPPPSTSSPSAAPIKPAAPTSSALPTLSALSLPTVALSAPAIQQRFPLSDLPGAGRHPYELALLGDKLYVLNTTSNNLAVIQDDRVTRFIPVGKSPIALAADALLNRLYVSNAGDKSVSLIVNDQVTLTQNIGAEASALLFFENRLYVGLDTQDGILVLDPTTLQTQAHIIIPKIFSVISLAGDPARHRVYANVYEKTAVIDAATLSVVSVFPDAESYYTLVVNPTDGTVMMSVYDPATRSQSLTGFDPATGAARGRVKIGGDPYGAASRADGSRIYVANSFTNDVTVVDPRSQSVVATIPVSLRPKGVALDEKAHRLYVANSGSDSLSVVDTDSNQSIATIPVGMMPTALLSNENAGRVYVANASTDSVFVIEGNRVVKEIPTGHHPIDLSRDEQSNRLFVANETDRTLTIIDEASFNVQSTPPITQSVTTVAVDAAHARVFVNDVILDLKTLAPIGQLTLRTGVFVGTSLPDLVRVSPSNGRIYANGSNGIPGSNGREVTYSIDGKTLAQRGILDSSGSTLAFAVDPDTNRVFLSSLHPMALTSALTVLDANDKRLLMLPLPSRATAIAYNPQTHHLFLSHAPNYGTLYVPTRPPADDMIQIFDTNSWGEVGRLDMDSPGQMARLGSTLYVASEADGSITLIRDVAVPAPPSPTPTFTPTPYPSLTPTSPAAARVPSPTPRTASLPVCSIPIGALAPQRWTAQVAAQLGCPTELERTAQFAVEPFERGTLFYRDDEKRIYVLFADKTWSAFDDTWNASLPDDSCPSVQIPAGLTKPRRGFGKVWCDQSKVRSSIGAAIAIEHGLYSALTQRFERGQMFASEQPSLVFVLYSDNQWD